MKTRTLHDLVRSSAQLLAVAGLYYASARLGLLLQLPGTNASPVWPPSGIGLAALLLFGLRVWPGITLGAFLANLLTLPLTAPGMSAASAIAVGNTLEQVVALLVLRKLVPSLHPFDRPGDLLRFLATTALACAVASTIGATSLWLAGIVGGGLYAPVWFTWWLGDAAGILVLTPAAVCWWRNPRLGLPARRALELAMLAGVTALTAELTFGGWLPVAVPFVVVAGPLWAAFRFGPRETSLLPVLLSVITVAHVWQQAERLMASGGAAGVYVPFVSGAASVNNSLLMLQLFVCGVGITSVMLAGAVAERAQTAERLRDSELRFRTIFEQAAVGVAMIDTATGRFIRVNRCYRALIGYTPDEMTRTTYMALTHPDDLQEDLDQMRHLVAGAIDEFTMEKRLFRRDGSVVWVNLTVSPTWRAGEAPKHHIAIVEDITARKRAEDALRRSQAKLRLVTDHAPVLLVHCDAGSRYTFVNRPYSRRFGLEPEEVVGRTIPEVLGEPAYERIRAYVDEALAGREVEFQIEVPYQQIGRRTMHCVYRPELDADGRVNGFLGTILDVTERVRTETALRESEQRFRLLTDALPHMVWTLRADLTLGYLNRRASEFTGYSAERASRDGWQHLVHPDDLPGMLATVSGPLQRGEPHEAEYRFRHHTGEYRRVVSTAVPVKDEAGAVTQWIGCTLDIHDRWLAERQFRLAVEASPSAILMVNREGRIVLVNALAERLFGYDREELLGAPIELLVPAPVRAKHPGLREAFFASPTARAMGAGRDLYGQRKDGGRFPVEIGLNPIESAEGTLALAAVVDITARKQAEEQFHTAVESSPSGMVMIDDGGRVVMVNRQTEMLFGYDRAELLGQPVEVLLPERFRAEHPGARAAFFARPTVRSMGGGRDLWGRRKDGTEFPVEVGLNPVQLASGWHALASIIDISSRRAAEQELRELNATLERRVAERTVALRESEERFRSAFEHATIGMALVAPDGRWLQVNRSVCELVGYTEQELLATDFQSITHPDDLDADLGHVRQMLGGAILTYQMEKRYFHKQGHVVYILLSVSLVRGGNGEPLYFISQIQDITERKKAEQLAKANEALLRQFIKHSPAAIAMFDRDMRYLQCSDRWLTDYHLPGRGIIGLTHYEVFPDIPAHWKAAHRRVLAGAVEMCDEDPFRRAGDSTEWLQWECRPWLNAAGRSAASSCSPRSSPSGSAPTSRYGRRCGRRKSCSRKSTTASRTTCRSSPRCSTCNPATRGTGRRWRCSRRAGAG
jgi:PAS domain S-box-containing protein